MTPPETCPDNIRDSTAPYKSRTFKLDGAVRNVSTALPSKGLTKVVGLRRVFRSEVSFTEAVAVLTVPRRDLRVYLIPEGGGVFCHFQQRDDARCLRPR